MEEYWSSPNISGIFQGKRKKFAWNLICGYCVFTKWGRDWPWFKRISFQGTKIIIFALVWICGRDCESRYGTSNSNTTQSSQIGNWPMKLTTRSNYKFQCYWPKMSLSKKSRIKVCLSNVPQFVLVEERCGIMIEVSRFKNCSIVFLPVVLGF